MDVLTAPAAASKESTNTTTSASAKSAATDYETFLTLLTAQMKNQDPLKPMDSTDFVAQLASFSSVEQQIRTNDALSQIEKLLGGSSPSGLSSWIGLNVQIPKDPQFKGVPIDVFVDPAAAADRADLVVQNSSGEELRRISVPSRTDVYTWAGMFDDGAPMPNGSYRLSVESFKAGELIDSKQAPIYESVLEARLDAGTTLLVLDDGTTVSAEHVTAVRGR